MKILWMAGAACALAFAGSTAHAKAVCDIHHLGYTQAQCDECTNMTWSVSRIFPKGTCVATAAPQAARQPAPPPKRPCDIHHLGYTKTQCDECSNMTWSVSKVFPQGTCVSTAPPPTLNTGTRPPTPTPAGPACTPTPWGGATVPLAAPNFSLTGVKVTACTKGYVFARSQFTCSNGVPAMPANAPTTNITCNRTTGPGGVFNPQVMINGTPCCIK